MEELNRILEINKTLDAVIIIASVSVLAYKITDFICRINADIKKKRK